MPSEESETIYDRIAKLEDEVAALRSEIDFLKRALRNELARHEVKMAKKGTEAVSYTHLTLPTICSV